jgi:anti-sigma regulatory factor (Ser/Thr protein kinase)
MTSLPTRHKKGGGMADNSTTSTRVGQVYLDVRRRHLSCLDPVSRQLHQEGIPFTPADLDRCRLLTPAGQVVAGPDLPVVAAWREEKPVEATYIVRRENSPECRVAWNAAPVRDAQGRLIGVAGTIRCGPPEPDWQALAGLAHDLRTPLNAITLQLAVVNHLAADNPELAKMLAGIHSSADNALRVGMEMLDWCRGAGQRGRAAEAAWFALEPLLAQLAYEQGLAARKKGLALSTELAACRGWEVCSDRTRLARILSNLLVNAVRYTPAGRVHFATAWQDRGKGHVLAVVVEDTGVGIAPEEQDSIFQPFERGQAGKEGDSGGSGLGLAVVDRLVEDLGMQLEVDSEYGRGSAFRLLMPAGRLRPAKSGDTQLSPEQTVRSPRS